MNSDRIDSCVAICVMIGLHRLSFGLGSVSGAIEGATGAFVVIKVSDDAYHLHHRLILCPLGGGADGAEVSSP